MTLCGLVVARGRPFPFSLLSFTRLHILYIYIYKLHAYQHSPNIVWWFVLHRKSQLSPNKQLSNFGIILDRTFWESNGGHLIMG